MRHTPLQKARRRVKRFLLLCLALLFLFESWLWDATGAAVAKIAELIPIERWKERFARRIAHFSPWLTLGVFIIPVLVLLPMKFTALFLLANGYLFGGIGMIIFAKLVGFGIGSFLFILCKPKLLQLRWVEWLYDHCVRLRAKAHAFAAPYLRFIKRYVKAVRALLPRSRLRERIRASKLKRQPSKP